MIDTKIKILTNNVSLLRYFQNSLFCLINLFVVYEKDYYLDVNHFGIYIM